MRTLALLITLALAGVAHASGYSRSANFIVHAPDQETSDAVCQNAERYRAEVARDWFGKELPDGAGRSVISVSFERGRISDGWTWAIDHPQRTLHNVWLATPDKTAIAGALLKHEVCHTVFATFHNAPRVPAKLEERIASTYNADKPEPAGRLKSELRRWQTEARK